MYDQIRQDTLYLMLYAAVTMLSLNACCYLLFRQGNAIAKDITPPVRLRRWTATFFAFITLSHVWYIPMAFLSSSDDVMIVYYIGVLLDCMIIIPLAIIVLLAMLQDRRRPLWPIAVMVFFPIVIMAWCVVSRSDALLAMLRVYLLLLGIGLIIYMVRAVRQYGRWLRDNYADLEHKEVWQSFVVLAIILLVFGIYALGINSQTYCYIVQINDIVLICYLLWRVETLSDLNIPQSQNLSVAEPSTTEAAAEEEVEGYALSQTNRDRSTLVAMPAKNVEALLQNYCIDTQLYLQHDLTVFQLAQAIGINRLYLTHYFSRQDMSYNVTYTDIGRHI